MRRFKGGPIDNDDDYGDAVVMVDEYRRRKLIAYAKGADRVLHLSDKEALLINTLFSMMVAAAEDGSPTLSESLGRTLVKIIGSFTPEEQWHINAKVSDIVFELPDDLLKQYGSGYRMRNMTEGLAEYKKVDEIVKHGPTNPTETN